MSKSAFDSVNARAVVIGQRLMTDALRNEDVATLMVLKTTALELYDTIIELAKAKPDYPTWHAAMMKGNLESPLNQLDVTGEFTRVVKDLGKIDATGYYFEVIAPMLVGGPDVLIAERAVIASQLDYTINSVVLARRARIKMVR